MTPPGVEGHVRFAGRVFCRRRVSAQRQKLGFGAYTYASRHEWRMSKRHGRLRKNLHDAADP